MDINEIIIQFIKPELLVLVPVLYFIGAGFKKAQSVKDKHIPLLLGGCGIALSILWILATTTIDGWQSALLAIFTAIVQGIICAGASVYFNQIVKQLGKTE